ncbi:MAG: S49 family peptidase [Oceanospirillaceae bacterium]|uniref:S49 family peptidase n=1 Tax=unclassified Thalassolituus TaxID=2624967 RepID=UPI000C54FF17|nr:MULTISPECIES: S49 family peptidase [unclassified Thalassolituus]MAS25454.1 S49 family peptidase [Oceanospirillaceae bacterium]MAX98993.1 S49 family peptidase [Oceanospirillaceae bacterium]MBS53268.1 S49 family peptidase [Oceanospirillaceae bacterium]
MDNQRPTAESGRPQEDSKEWKLIEKMLTGLQSEQKRSRRWGIFFKSLTFVYLFALLWLIRLPGEDAQLSRPDSYAAVIEVNGVIAADEEASADRIVSSLRDAFDDESAVGVILRINSPGGSPVQSGYVYDEIKRLKEIRPDFPVYAVIMDLGASGAYYIAAAADEIYADKASLVGSIGVVGSGFGFTGIMEKLGVERRQYTAGAHKGFLDPFQPENPDEKAFWEGVLKVTHNQFIDQVKKGRGDRLKLDTPDLFSGLVWSGEQALDIGLIDGLASSSQVAREKLGTDELVSFTHQPKPWEDLISRLGASFGRGIATFMSEQTISLR